MAVIRYDELLDVADEAKNWYAGQGDPIYALVSSVYAGHDVPLQIAEDALRNLEIEYGRTKNSADREALGDAIYELEYNIAEVRMRARALPNPLTAPWNWSVGAKLTAAAIIAVGTIYAINKTASSSSTYTPPSYRGISYDTDSFCLFAEGFNGPAQKPGTYCWHVLPPDGFVLVASLNALITQAFASNANYNFPTATAAAAYVQTLIDKWRSTNPTASPYAAVA